MKPKLLIVSSTEGRLVAREVQRQLAELGIDDATLWDDGRVFRPNFAAFESLLIALDTFHFAIAILSPDDTLVVRRRTQRAVRDNVLFELGMFFGRFGRERAFVIRHAKCRVPTDLAGVELPTYAESSGRGLQRALHPICRLVAESIEASPPTVRQVVQFVTRGDSEGRGSDQPLQRAREATFVALTYKTLGQAVTNPRGLKKLPKLRRATLFVPALPVLYRHHPTLGGNDFSIRSEWTTNIARSIAALCSTEFCPALEHLDLKVLSVPPTFTMSLLEETAKPSIVTLRFTPIVSGVEPKHLPTLSLRELKSAPSPLVAQFRTMIDALGQNQVPLSFALRRDGRALYSDFAALVARLSQLCNNPQYEPADLAFELKQDGRLANGRGPVIVDDTAAPTDCIGAAEVGAEFDFARRVVRRLRVAGRRPQRLRFGEKHILGVFGVLTFVKDGVPSVLLVQYPKATWTYDVPGGKAALGDSTCLGVLKRELFEELGLILDEGRALRWVGLKYDEKSALTGKPVIACYYHYPLSHDERADMLDRVRTSTKGKPLIGYALADLIADQRGRDGLRSERVCHAPIEVLERVQEWVTKDGARRRRGVQPK